MRRPNFLLIVTDQQRCDHVGAYGNRIVKTPNIDALAERGWVSDRFYVASPACMPNRASLMTGRLPSLHGARHNGIPLPLTQEEIGDATGLTAVHVNRMLRQLEDEALIARENGRVTIRNAPALMRTANYVDRFDGLDLGWLPEAR